MTEPATIAFAAGGLAAAGAALWAFRRQRDAARRLRRELEAERSRLRQALEKLSDMEPMAHLGALATRIVHDMNGPLTAIKGYAQLIRETPGLDKAVRQDAATVMQEADRVSVLIERIARYARPASQAEESVSLRDLVENTLGVLSFDVKARGVDFQKVFPSEDLRVLVRRRAMQQALFNSFKCALDAAGPAKRMAVSLERHGREGRLEILAAGASASAPDLQAARDALESHKGAIHCESKPSENLKIVIRIPLAPSPQ
jgi:signal transduction histidine kinase